MESGLKESWAKTQVAARGRQKCRQLADNCDPSWVKTEVQFLGATSVSKPRSDAPSEVKRIQASFQRAALLCSIGMGWSRSLRAHKTFVLSKFSYGWVARPCTLGVSKKLFTWLSRALKTGTNASPWLRKILYGAQTDMSCVSMTRQWTRLRKRILCNHRPSWNLGAHTSIHILRKKLHTMGWREVEPWLWKKPPLWDQLTPHDFRILDLRTLRQDEQLQLHTLRLAYKQQCFVNLLEQKKQRREVTQLRTQFTLEQLCQFFSAVDLEATWRQLQNTDGAGRAVLLGSFRSPLCNHRANPDLYVASCPHCKHPMGSHDHLFWQCPALAWPSPMAPVNPLQSRFGWFCFDPGPVDSERVFIHMRSVVQRTWDVLDVISQSRA